MTNGVYRTASSGGFVENEPAAPSVLLNDQVQFNSVDLSLSTATAVCEALKKALATQTAQVTSLQDQLSSANAANETGAQLLSALRNRMEEQMSETQKARDELRRAENDLSVMGFERAETETSLQALRAEVADVKFQNSRLTSENQRLETEMAQITEEYVQITDALGGLSSTTVQQFHESPAISPYIEDDNLPNQLHDDFDLAALVQLEFDETDALGRLSSTTFQQFHESPATSPYIEDDNLPNQLHNDFDLALAALSQLEFDEELLCEQQEPSKDIRCLFECGVCMDEQPEDYVTLLDLCGHKFCRDCIRNHIGTKLAEHCFPILCPVCMTEGGKSDPGSE